MRIAVWAPTMDGVKVTVKGSLLPAAMEAAPGPVTVKSAALAPLMDTIGAPVRFNGAVPRMFWMVKLTAALSCRGS